MYAAQWCCTRLASAAVVVVLVAAVGTSGGGSVLVAKGVVHNLHDASVPLSVAHWQARCRDVVAAMV